MFIFLLFLLLLPASASADRCHYDSAADFICKKILGKRHYSVRRHFTKEFRDAVPEWYFREGMNGLADAVTGCDWYSFISKNKDASVVQFVSPRGDQVVAKLILGKGGLIDTFGIMDVEMPSIQIASWEDAKRELDKLPGNKALTLTEFHSTYHGYNDKERHPLASGFKLYVLGELADAITENRVQWADTYPLQAKWKSLPSGVMHEWKNGKEISLLDYAKYMIRISDNTATDHLIHILGRENVERQLSFMGNSYASYNLPLLTTAEVFKIIWAAPVNLIHRYLRSSEQKRRRILENRIQSIPLKKVGTNGVPEDEPSYIKEVGWYGSTQDLCRAMQSLSEKESPEIFQILGQNTPLLEPGKGSHWKYAGYKGGSIPGVLTLTYLLQSHSDHWGCLSLSWHNEQATVNEWTLFDILQKSLTLAESVI